MITTAELTHINSHAYVPEHIPAYVTAVSDAEPYLFQPFLCYMKHDTLIFIGYPLGEPFEENGMKKALDRATKNLKPVHIALVAPSVSMFKNKACDETTSDTFYRLDTQAIRVPQKVRNMVNRASRSLSVETGADFGDGHLRMIAEFLETHDIGKDTRYIFDRIPMYVAASQTAIVMDARDSEGKLVAFDIAEFGAKDYAFYMFNFVPRKLYVPGVSDLLLNQLIQSARERGKRFINLGLGINKGVAFFKVKWAGAPFLAYEFCQYEVRRKQVMDDLWGKL
jgi:hypothetical protein